MKKLRWLASLMALVILVITSFQLYWLKDNYDREKNAVATKTNVLFHETVRLVQDSLVQQKLRYMLSDSSKKLTQVVSTGQFRRRTEPGQDKAARLITLIRQRPTTDSVVNERKEMTGHRIAVSNGARPADDSHLRIIMDSLRPEEIDQLVEVGGDSRLPMRIRDKDSLRYPTNLRDREMISIAETETNGTGTHPSSQINTIYLSNDKGIKVSIQIDSLFNDSVSLKALSATLASTMRDEKLDLPFTIIRNTVAPRKEDDFMKRPMVGNFGGYELKLGNTFPFVIKRLSLPILFSFFLVGITIFSFVLLYRSLLNQYRLGQIKNDLISNITHELKTPIATVAVAIEALKSFNARQDAQRTEEYLDISQHELQRLGLLVDKVLKLSMFEKKELEVKYELFDLKDTFNEVIASLRLQIEKYNARVVLETDGDMTLEGDRHHLLSVVFNLLDNALKYSKGNAAIQVQLKEDPGSLIMKITDNGIGIPAVYKDKIFEKFFRVPTGDKHNAKGHGLGLSYISQVVRQHKGTISVESLEGIGSTFTIVLPRFRDNKEQIISNE